MQTTIENNNIHFGGEIYLIIYVLDQIKTNTYQNEAY